MSACARGRSGSCSDHHGEDSSVLDLPLPAGLKREWLRLETRRHFLGRAGKALGWAGLASLLGDRAFAGAEPAGAAPRFPSFAPKARRAIFLFMSGAPAQHDLWDWKPGLAGKFDEDLPESVRGQQVLTGMTSGQARFPIAPTVYKFSRPGRSGLWISELLPWTAKIVDELAVIKSMHTDAINHEPAILLINTGSMVPGKPSLGAWLSYGLGSLNQNLPSFVVLNSKLVGGNAQPTSPRLWGSGFLSSAHAGVAFRAQGDPVLYLSDPPGMTPDLRRAMLDGVRRMNELAYAETGDPETQARITQYEMAFRMQTSVPELVDFRGEPASTWDLYGPDAREPGTFAYNCLVARRLAERGVRFTQVYQRGWDQHGNLTGELPKLCAATDRACYALVTDLKQRGLLEDTLVVWGGEFGRTVYSQGSLSRTNYGRDHHPRCFSVWLAGGGVRRGVSYGETDDYGYNIARDPVHVRDLNATILHLLGIDHNRLTFRTQGLDQKLTGVLPAQVVDGILA